MKFSQNYNYYNNTTKIYVDHEQSRQTPIKTEVENGKKRDKDYIENQNV